MHHVCVHAWSRLQQLRGLYVREEERHAENLPGGSGLEAQQQINFLHLEDKDWGCCYF